MSNLSAHNMSFEELCCFSDFASLVITDLAIRRKTFKTDRSLQPVMSRSQKNKIKKLLNDAKNDDSVIDRIWKQMKELTVVQSYLRDKTSDEILKIDAHCIRYLKVIGPKSEFSVVKCDRFEADENEGVKIVSKTKMRTGYIITDLVICTSLHSDEQYETLTHRAKNYLFDNDMIGLGPAAWINHSCTPNVKFVWLVDGCIMGVQTLEPIESGQEILVKYSEGHFGNECGCDKCNE